MPSTPEVTLPTTKPKISASATDSPSIAANTPPRSRDPWARMSRVTSHNPPPIRQTMKRGGPHAPAAAVRSEEHTSELQSQSKLVCRLLLEKKKNNRYHTLNNLE